MIDLHMSTVDDDALRFALGYKLAAKGLPDFASLTEPAKGMVAGAVAQLSLSSTEPVRLLWEQYTGDNPNPARWIGRELRDEMVAWGVEA